MLARFPAFTEAGGRANVWVHQSTSKLQKKLNSNEKRQRQVNALLKAAGFNCTKKNQGKKK